MNAATIDSIQEFQKRIVAMLLALAFVAECASRRSRPVRALVLWILRPAEAIARNFLQEAVDNLAVGSPFEAWRMQNALADFFDDLPSPATERDTAWQALLLATRFRALALAFERLPAQALVFHSEPLGYNDITDAVRLDALLKALGALVRTAIERPEVRSGVWPQTS